VRNAIRLVWFIPVLVPLSILAVPAPQKAPVAAKKNPAVERGRYLVSVLACNDCHTPKKMTDKGPVLDESRLLSGHPESAKLPPPPALPAGPWNVVASWDLTAWSGPWGISYPMNLTPDEHTGIGSWSEETLIKAIRTGKHMGVSREILPPMPWEVYRNLSDEDLKAVHAYLRTIPAIKNQIPDPVPPKAPPAPPAAKK